MPIPLIPVAVAATVTLGGLAAKRFFSKSGMPKMEMTPARAEILRKTLNTTNLAASKIREVAAAFGAEGFKEEEQLLMKRAALRELTPEVKQSRREIFKKALNSRDKKQVEAIADAFEKEGAVGAANNLRKYAAGLE